MYKLTILVVLMISFNNEIFGGIILRATKNSYNLDEQLKCVFTNINMSNRTKKSVVIAYLRYYESKNLKGIEDLFSEDIVLRDWKIRVEGKRQALAETKKNFDAVDALKIEVLNLYENENTVAAELKIIINNKEELYVVDVITINADAKISSIKAFIGRGN